MISPVTFHQIFAHTADTVEKVCGMHPPAPMVVPGADA